MDAPSEGMLAQRQLRAAEIALETARQRRREADEEMRRLGLEVAAAQHALATSEAARAHDRIEAEERLRVARVGQITAEQGHRAERERRIALERQLGALRREGIGGGELPRQLAAEARIAELEGDLERVTRRAAAFEYGVRMAAFDAFKLVRDMTDLVTGLVARTGLIAAPSRVPEVEAGTPAQPPDRDAVGPPSVASGLDSERLDAALDRLRATTPPPPDEP